MSDCPDAALPTAPGIPSTDARAARLEKFKREQQIVNYLNRGLSVPEIAARVGLSEKRMRAVIGEIVARRAPAPPEEFLTIQVSRLNEALLVAFSAMTGANLKAVDRVVRIVRELDRYHGAFAAARRQRPDPERLEAPAEATAAYGAALICQAQFAPAHDEEIEGAPGIVPDREDPSPAPVLIEGSSPATSEVPPAASTGDNRPQPPSRAPDFPRPRPEEPARAGVSKSLPRAWRGDDPTSTAVGARRNVLRDASPTAPLLRTRGMVGSYNRPENLLQGVEKVESAPGVARQETSDPAAPASGLQDAPPLVAPHHEGGEAPPAASPGDKRPENSPQDFEKVESAPGHGWLAQAASASEGATVGPAVPSSGFPFCRVRMTLNGAVAC